MVDAGEDRFVCVPVFPSRAFRHGFIFINRNAGIRTPKDLEGKKVGVGLYTQTAAVWIRGHLQNDFGVDIDKIHWIQGAIEKPGAHGNPVTRPLLKPIDLVDNHSAYSIADLLARGEIDAFIGAQIPASVRNGAARRLFPDYHARETDYFRRTRIHPIMHLVAIRRAVYERNPWIAAPLYRAFVEAKDKAWANLCHTGANGCMLPFVYAYAEETRALMGDDPWPYGVEANIPTLQAMTRYMYTQGLCTKHFAPQDLFVPVTA